MALVLHANAYNKNAWKGLIAAEYSGVQVELVKNFEIGVSNMSPEFIKMNPLGKVPVLETPDGPVFESNAIARYVTRSKADNPLYGSSLIEYAHIEQWMDFAATEIDPSIAGWFYPRLGYRPFIQQAEELVIANLKRALGALNTHLASTTYLVEHTVTLADIVMTCNLYPGFTGVMTKTFSSEFPHVERYFWTLVNQPNFRKVMGEVKQTESIPPVPSAKKPTQAKESKPKEAKKEAKKEAPKPKVEEATAEEEEAAKPKPKNPLDLLPPSEMILDEWKRLYSNTKTNFREVAIKGFWNMYDPEQPMDPRSKDPSSGGGGDPDEFTIALKRSRRVSFAETTAVHVFDRDEDFETPPDSKPSSEGLKVGSEEELGFRGEHFSSDDSNGLAREEDKDEEEDDDGEQERFIRDMDLSSPGSAVGSVTSNDEDNFFGPVSTSFIKYGRLSEAGMADDNNHDITLDSTTFSLHFRNVVPPDDRSANSAGSLRTPTGDSVSTDFDGFVVSKGFKHQVPRAQFFDGKMSGSAGDSSNMSLIVENPDSYDRYGKMSPTLVALLAEANKSRQPNSPFCGSATKTSQHDTHVSVGVKQSAEDELHIRKTDGTGVADDVCFDSNLSEGRLKGICTDRNENDVTSNKLTSLSIDALLNDNTQVTLSPKFNGYSKDIPRSIQSNVVAKDVQNTDMLSPPNKKSNNNLQSDQVHEELFQDQVSGSKHSLDPSLHSLPIFPVLVDADGQQQLLSENIMQTPQNALQPLQSPLPGSVSSLRSKRQQLFLDSFVLSQNRLMHTPDKEEPLSSLKMKLIQHGERISAIKVPKSIIHKSPIIIDSRPTLSDKDTMSFELEGTLENDSHNAKHMGVLASNQKVSLHVAREATGQSIGIQLNHSGSPTASNESVLANLGKNEVGKNKAVSGPVKLTTGSSVQLSQSEVNRKGNLTSFDNPIEQFFTLGEHSSSVGQAIGKESSQILDTPHGTISSPIKMLGDKLSASQGGYSSPGVDGTSLRSSLERNGLQSSKPLTGPNSDEVSKLQIPKKLEKNISPLYKFQEQIEESRNFHNGDQNQSTMMEKQSGNMNDKLSIEGTSSSDEPLLDSANKLQATVNVSMKFLAEGTIQRPNNTMDGDKNMLTSVSPTESLPSNPTQDPILHDNDLNCHNLQSAEEPLSVQSGLTGKKRGIDQIIFTDNDHVSEVSRTQKSPKISPDVAGCNFVVFPGNDVESSEEPVDIGGQAPPKHWTDILSKVSEATKQLFQSSICKLNSGELEILEDILGELQTAKKYERLYTSLKNHNCLGEHQKRVAEARSLLDKLVYQKAKLQLKQLKRDELHNKGQLYKSKIQECAKLKSIYSQFCVLDARTVRHQESQLSSDLNKTCTRDQVEHNRVTSMRLELEMLDQKVKRMMKAFETSCKIKGNTSCDEIIKVATHHIEMKNCCRLIQQDLQLWKLSGIVKENDQCDVVLNYFNLLTQRFTIYSRSAISIVANNFLNNESIEKNFPNMNACVAFEFVFKVKRDSRLTNSKQLSQETLETNLLLGSLLDVLDEILVSRMQSWNLISSTFHLQRSGQLDLQLSFLSFKSGRKVTLSLDLNFLNCAAYPSKLSDLQIRISETETTLPPLISDKIRGAVESLESGRSMIVRLCQSISKVVQDSHES